MSGRRNVCLRPLSGGLAGGLLLAPAFGFSAVRVWGGVPYSPSTGVISALASGPDLGLLLSGEPLAGRNKTRENLPLSSRSVSFLLCFFKAFSLSVLVLVQAGHIGEKAGVWGRKVFLLVSCRQSKRDPFSALLQGAQPSY